MPGSNHHHHQNPPGIPQKFVEEQLDDVTSAVVVNINCPDGADKPVSIPELAEGAAKPTCGEVKVKPATYAYCQFGTGLPTSIKELAYQSATFNGTNVAAPEYMKYLWEVVEIDKPLTQNREVGTIVETLGIIVLYLIERQEQLILPYSQGYRHMSLNIKS